MNDLLKSMLMVNIHLDAAFDHMERVEIALPPNKRKIVTDCRRFIEKEVLREIEKYHQTSPEIYSDIARGVENTVGLMSTLSMEEFVIFSRFINETIAAIQKGGKDV